MFEFQSGRNKFENLCVGMYRTCTGFTFRFRKTDKLLTVVTRPNVFPSAKRIERIMKSIAVVLNVDERRFEFSTTIRQMLNCDCSNQF